MVVKPSSEITNCCNNLQIFVDEFGEHEIREHLTSNVPLETFQERILEIFGSQIEDKKFTEIDKDITFITI